MIATHFEIDLRYFIGHATDLPLPVGRLEIDLRYFIGHATFLLLPVGRLLNIDDA